MTMTYLSWWRKFSSTVTFPILYGNFDEKKCLRCLFISLNTFIEQLDKTLFISSTVSPYIRMYRLEITKLFCAFFGCRYTKWFLFIIVEIARISCTFAFGNKMGFNLQFKKNIDENNEMRKCICVVKQKRTFIKDDQNIIVTIQNMQQFCLFLGR